MGYFPSRVIQSDQLILPVAISSYLWPPYSYQKYAPTDELQLAMEMANIPATDEGLAIGLELSRPLFLPTISASGASPSTMSIPVFDSVTNPVAVCSDSMFYNQTISRYAHIL